MDDSSLLRKELLQILCSVAFRTKDYCIEDKRFWRRTEENALCGRRPADDLVRGVYRTRCCSQMLRRSRHCGRWVRYDTREMFEY